MNINCTLKRESIEKMRNKKKAINEFKFPRLMEDSAK